jgi:hypothetical protein
MFVSITPASTAVALPAASAELNLLDILQAEQPELPLEEIPVLLEAVTNSSEPKTLLETAPVAGGEFEFERQDNSFGLWLIGLGSLILIVLGVVRRFSGR